MACCATSRSRARPTNRGSASPAIHDRPSRAATTAVVPEPTNGSTTSWPGALDARISFSISASGFWVACGVFSAMPLQITGSSITSRGLAPSGLGSQRSRRAAAPPYCDDTAWTRAG